MSTSGVGYEQLNAPLKAMINAGGGGTGGAGGSFIVAPQFSTVKLTQASNTVNTNLSNFNKDFDTLLTFKNSVYIGQGDSYNIISDTQIQSSDQSNWEAGTVFQFVGLCVNRAPSVLKCVSIKNKIELTTSSSFIDVGIRDFDAAADTLLLFENGVYMEKVIDYRIEDSKIYPIGDTMFRGTPDCPLIFNMIVLRNVVDPDAVKDFEGDNIKDLTITMNKLTQDIQNILNNPQDKRVGNMSLLKTSKKDTLVNSINELFQSASNGKTLVANAITGKGVQSNSNMTYQQLATNITNIKTGYTKEEIIYNGIATRYRVEVVSEKELNTNGYTNKLANAIHDEDRDERDHGSQYTNILRGKDNPNSLMMYYSNGNGYGEYSGVYWIQYMNFNSFALTSDASGNRLYNSEKSKYESIPRRANIQYGEIKGNPTVSTSSSYNGTTSTTTKCMIRLATPVTTYDLIEIPNAFYIFNVDSSRNQFTTIVEKKIDGSLKQYKTVYRVVPELVDANGNVLS